MLAVALAVVLTVPELCIVLAVAWRREKPASLRAFLDACDERKP